MLCKSSVTPRAAATSTRARPTRKGADLDGGAAGMVSMRTRGLTAQDNSMSFLEVTRSGVNTLSNASAAGRGFRAGPQDSWEDREPGWPGRNERAGGRTDATWWA